MARVRSWLDYHNGDPDFVEYDVGTVNNEPSMTQQHFASSCDINNLMSVYRDVSLIPSVNSAKAMYGDFTEIPDYQKAQQVMIDARKVWESLPDKWRQRFETPFDFLRFVEDPRNREEADRLGMLKLKKDISPVPPAGGSEGPPASGSGPT